MLDSGPPVEWRLTDPVEIGRVLDELSESQAARAWRAGQTSFEAVDEHLIMQIYRWQRERGRLKLGSNITPFAYALAHPDSGPCRRAAALRLLSASANTDPREIILHVLQTDSAPEVRLTAVRSLSAFDDGATLEALLAVLQTETAARIRAEAALSLGLGGSLEAGPLLLDVLAHSDDEALRAAAAWSLGSLGSQASLEGLIQALDDPAQSVRDLAADALGRLRDPRAIAALAALLDDGDPLLSQIALQALRRIDTSASLEAARVLEIRRRQRLKQSGGAVARG